MMIISFNDFALLKMCYMLFKCACIICILTEEMFLETFSVEVRWAVSSWV